MRRSLVSSWHQVRPMPCRWHLLGLKHISQLIVSMSVWLFFSLSFLTALSASHSLALPSILYVPHFPLTPLYSSLLTLFPTHYTYTYKRINNVHTIPTLNTMRHSFDDYLPLSFLLSLFSAWLHISSLYLSFFLLSLCRSLSFVTSLFQ